MKTAIVADWLPTFAGAEHVIAELTTIWPEAPLFTTIANHGELGPLDTADIRTTSLQRWYKLLGTHRPLLPFMPRSLESINLSGYDVIVSSSHAVGKGIVPPSNAVHICYCHTPMRYAWEMEQQYLSDYRIPNTLRQTVRLTLSKLRRWDLTAAKRVDTFVANSGAVQERIKRIYGRESVVIHPPASSQFFVGDVNAKRSGLVAIGRLVPYKRYDLLIAVANRLQLPLTIAGDGPDSDRLKRMAGPTVRMLGRVADAILPELYRSASALLFPQEEDAGVVPLEAQACGTPIIAYGVGGALDTVVEGKTGLFFPEQTEDSLIAAINKFKTMQFDPNTIREHAKQFHADRFREKMSTVVEETKKKYGK